MRQLIRTPVIAIALVLWCAVSTANATPILASQTGLLHPTNVITFDELGHLGEVLDVNQNKYAVIVTNQFSPFGVTFYPPAPTLPNFAFYWSGPADTP